MHRHDLAIRRRDISRRELTASGRQRMEGRCDCLFTLSSWCRKGKVGSNTAETRGSEKVAENKVRLVGRNKADVTPRPLAGAVFDVLLGFSRFCWVDCERPAAADVAGPRQT